MRMLTRFFFMLLSLLAMQHLAYASVVVDQINNDTPWPNYYSSGIIATGDYQQSVTVGLTGQLVGLDIYTISPGPMTILPFELKIGTSNAGAAIPPASLLYDNKNILFGSFGWGHIDLTSANLFFNAGDEFIFELIGAQTKTGRVVTGQTPMLWITGYGNGYGPAGYFYDNYGGGSAWMKSGANWVNNLSGIPLADLKFQTQMLIVDPVDPPVATPEPMTMMLMGVGIAGGALLKRKNVRL